MVYCSARDNESMTCVATSQKNKQGTGILQKGHIQRYTSENNKTSFQQWPTAEMNWTEKKVKSWFGRTSKLKTDCT